MPAKDEMPATLERSPAKARRTWAKALGIKGRSSMSKEELGEAIARKQ